MASYSAIQTLHQKTAAEADGRVVPVSAKRRGNTFPKCLKAPLCSKETPQKLRGRSEVGPSLFRPSVGPTSELRRRWGEDRAEPLLCFLLAFVEGKKAENAIKKSVENGAIYPPFGVLKRKTDSTLSLARQHVREHKNGKNTPLREHQNEKIMPLNEYFFIN